MVSFLTSAGMRSAHAFSLLEFQGERGRQYRYYSRRVYRDRYSNPLFSTRKLP